MIQFCFHSYPSTLIISNRKGQKINLLSLVVLSLVWTLGPLNKKSFCGCLELKCPKKDSIFKSICHANRQNQITNRADQRGGVLMGGSNGLVFRRRREGSLKYSSTQVSYIAKF